MGRIIKSIDFLNNWVGRIVSLALIPLILIVVVEVIRRYGFNSPSAWSFEISRFIFGGYIALGGGYTFLHKGHVAMDLVYTRLSLNMRAALDMCTSIFFFLFCGTFFVEMWKISSEAFENQQRVGTGAGYDPYIWPIYATLCVGGFLLLIQGVAELAKNMLIITRRGKETES